ncbi:MAG: hypothetical protein EA391_12340 [Balneolaceae bacterium]|nr:MAG: hypothetical protein EA391_12340 [Balneolaceae bacterium]
MARKEFIGLSIETERIRLARIRTSKREIELLEVDTIHLPKPVLSQRQAEINQQDFSGDYDAIFDTETQGSSSSLDDLDDLDSIDFDDTSTSGAKTADEDFDMTKEPDNVAEENEQMLALHLAKYSSSKLKFGLHVPFGKTTFQFLKNVDPSKMKKKDRKEYFEEKLFPIYTREVLDEHYAWMKTGENDCLLAYSPNELELLNLVELAETFSKKKLMVIDRQPDEALWVGLVRANYQLDDDEITCLIALGEKSSRIMFMKGTEIMNVLPIISEGEEEDQILNTIFSKILFEIDKGEVPKINRILLVRSGKKSSKAMSYFQKQFDDIEVNYLVLNSEKVTYADEILNSPEYLQPYISAIGAAWAASGVNDKAFGDFSLLPEYVREKQRVLKIEWHGIAILILIALTPLFINNLYFEKANELSQLEQEVSSMQAQIDELTPIANMTQDLITDFQVINAENNRLIELAEYSQKWSEVMRILNEGVSDIPSIWLTTLRTSGDHINLTGISLTREQIPVLAQLFSDANINQVSETEIRGQPVYSFSLQANNFRQDIDRFLLELPEFDFDSEFDSGDIPLDFSANPDEEFQPGTPITVTAPADQLNEPQITGQSPDVTEQSTLDEAISEAVQPLQTSAIAETAQSDDASSSELQQNSQINSAPAAVAETQNSPNSPYGLTGSQSELLFGAYTIVLHSTPLGNRAQEEQSNLREQGFISTLWQATLDDGSETWRVGVGQFETVDDALAAIPDLPEPYRSNNFIIRIR